MVEYFCPEANTLSYVYFHQDINCLWRQIVSSLDDIFLSG